MARPTESQRLLVSYDHLKTVDNRPLIPGVDGFSAVSAAGYGGIWRDTGRYREIPGDTGRYEIRADTGRYGQIRGDTGRCDEMQGDTGRYGQILQRYIKIPQKTVHRVVVCLAFSVLVQG